MEFIRKPEHLMGEAETAAFRAWEAWLTDLLVCIRKTGGAPVDAREKMPPLPDVWPATYNMDLVVSILDQIGPLAPAASQRRQ